MELEDKIQNFFKFTLLLGIQRPDTSMVSFMHLYMLVADANV